MPVFACLLAVAIERRPTSGAELAALAALAVGVAVAVADGGVRGGPWGVCLAVAGTAINAGMMSLSGKLMRERLSGEGGCEWGACVWECVRACVHGVRSLCPHSPPPPRCWAT